MRTDSRNLLYPWGTPCTKPRFARSLLVTKLTAQSRTHQCARAADVSTWLGPRSGRCSRSAAGSPARHSTSMNQLLVHTCCTSRSPPGPCSSARLRGGNHIFLQKKTDQPSIRGRNRRALELVLDHRVNHFFG